MAIAEVELPATATTPAERVPAIGQGSWHMAEGRASAADEVAALQHGLDRGLSVIDTAEMYASGGAEELVGRAIAGRREEAFLVSKVFPWNAGRESAVRACEASLRRLGTDYLDLYLLHWPGGIPLEETLEAFERLRDDGKIRRFGVSNYDIEDMQSLWATAGGREVSVNQVLYHAGSRGIEHSLLPWQREQGVPTMAYCPLAGGGNPLRHSAVTALAAELGVAPATLLLGWVIRHAPNGARDVVAIPKAARSEHVDANAAALTLTLPDDAVARLDQAFPAPTSKPPLDIV
jgi:diketogulonate reductase-like aldo/keto reductase